MDSTCSIFIHCHPTLINKDVPPQKQIFPNFWQLLQDIFTWCTSINFYNYLKYFSLIQKYFSLFSDPGNQFESPPTAWRWQTLNNWNIFTKKNENIFYGNVCSWNWNNKLQGINEKVIFEQAWIALVCEVFAYRVFLDPFYSIVYRSNFLFFLISSKVVKKLQSNAHQTIMNI